MPNDTQTSPRTRISITLSPGCSADLLPPAAPVLSASTSLLPERIVLDPQPRTSWWAGLSEGCRAIAEAEARIGAPLTKEDLRALYEAYLDVYEPHGWPKGPISDDWIAGWSRSFALAALQAERRRFPEPVRHGCEIAVGAPSTASTEDDGRGMLRFRQVNVRVRDVKDFWQGVWEGGCAAVDTLGGQVAVCGEAISGTINTGAAPGQASSVQLFDEVLEIMQETGNLGLDFVVGYLLGYVEGLLAGRQRYPARRSEAGHLSEYAGSIENT